MRKKIIKYTVLIAILVAIIVAFKVWSTPYKTKEEKLTKPIYKAAVENTSGIKLIRVSVDDRNNREINFAMKLKRERNDNYFTPEELQNLNQMVEQAIEFLNTDRGSRYDYDRIVLRLFSGKGNTPIYVACFIDRNDEAYYFSSVSTKHCSELFDFYVFENVREITIGNGNTPNFDEKRANQLSELNCLKAIYYPDIGHSYIEPLSKKLKEILPECKLYVNDREVYFE